MGPSGATVIDNKIINEKRRQDITTFRMGDMTDSDHLEINIKMQGRRKQKEGEKISVSKSFGMKQE